MPTLPTRIMGHAGRVPGGYSAVFGPSALLPWAAERPWDQALSRLARKGKLIRVC